MKTIEQLELNNIAVIDRYLNNELSEEQVRVFERRLKIDNELRLDFKIVVESYKSDYEKLKNLKKSRIDLDDLGTDMAHLRRKAGLGKRIINFGLMAVLFSLLLVIVCGVIIALFG